MADMRTQAAIMGIIPPSVAEAVIAVRWPSVSRFKGPAGLGMAMQETARGLFRGTIALPFLLVVILVVPVTILGFFICLGAWLMLAPLYFAKILPLTMIRYKLTNRRIMIQKGLSLKPTKEVLLEDIKQVRIVPGSASAFYLAGDIELVRHSGGSLILAGVPESEGFKRIIEDTWLAWGRKDPPKDLSWNAIAASAAAKK